jgi:hypothetical protein
LERQWDGLQSKKDRVAYNTLILFLSPATAARESTITSFGWIDSSSGMVSPTSWLTTWKGGVEKRWKRGLDDVERKGRFTLPSWIRTPIRSFNFIFFHYVYLLLWTIIGSVILYPGGIRYIDALFFSAAAATQSGLNTVDVNKLSTYQQVSFYLFGSKNTNVLLRLLFYSCLVYAIRLRLIHLLCLCVCTGLRSDFGISSWKHIPFAETGALRGLRRYIDTMNIMNTMITNIIEWRAESGMVDCIPAEEAQWPYDLPPKGEIRSVPQRQGRVVFRASGGTYSLRTRCLRAESDASRIEIEFQSHVRVSSTRSFWGGNWIPPATRY